MDGKKTVEPHAIVPEADIAFGETGAMVGVNEDKARVAVILGKDAIVFDEAGASSADELAASPSAFRDAEFEIDPEVVPVVPIGPLEAPADELGGISLPDADLDDVMVLAEVAEGMPERFPFADGHRVV